MNPHISVIIPVFNRPEKLERAVESVLGQAFSDFELIVVDDGSDSDYSSLKERLIAAGHTFLRIRRNGPAAARNHGAAQAQGTWLAFLDSDDLWRLDKLAIQSDFHTDNPSLLASQCQEIWLRNGKELPQKKYHQMPDGEAFEPSLRRCVISPSSVMLSRSLFEELGGFDERFPACEDYEFWLRLTARERVGLIRDKLVVKHGGHADQLSHAVPALDRYRLAALLLFLKNAPHSKKQEELVLQEVAYKLSVLLQGAKKRSAESAASYGFLLAEVEKVLAGGATVESLLSQSEVYLKKLWSEFKLPAFPA